MKLFVFGRGNRLFQVVDSFSAKKRAIAVVTDDDTLFKMLADKKVTRVLADPSKFDTAQFRIRIDPHDVIVVVEWREEHIRSILDNLMGQRVAAPIVVFTPQPAKDLAIKYPAVWFRNDKAVYREEVRDVLRRMETRSRVARLREIIAAAPQAGILVWGNPDPDSIGSSFALRTLMAEAAKDLVVAYMGEFTRPENKAMVDVLRIPMRKYEPGLIRPSATLITVDAQPSFFQNNGEMKFDVVIDHHPLATGEGPAYVDIRPEYGSTCTILTEYFQESGATMDRRIATALFLGLKVDTANLTRNVSDADIDAYRYLRERVDDNMLRSIELTQLPEGVLSHFATGLARRRTFGDVLITYLGIVDNPDVAVAVADFFIKVSGISVTVVAARANGRLVVIFRGDGLSTHVGRVAEALFLPLGTAGGHRTMARAEIDLEKAPELAGADEARTEHWLIGRLAKRLKGVRKNWREA